MSCSLSSRTGGVVGAETLSPSATNAACKSGQNPTQLRVSRANKQYIYSEDGAEYLDCLNGTAHVGHAHPHVASAGSEQIRRLTTAQGYVSDKTTEFVKTLATTVPHHLCVVYMCNSGAEATDLASRIVNRSTGNQALITMEDSFFGNLEATLSISPSIPAPRAPHVHVLPVPKVSSTTTDANTSSCTPGNEDDSKKIEASATHAEKIIHAAAAADRNGGVAGLFIDTAMVASGVRLLPSSYFERLFNCVRQNRGLCVVDESRAGLGRRGSHMWSFQRVGVTPDIITVGSSIGNGHPIGAVIATKEIAKSMDGYYSTFGGNPVACTMGTAVLRVLINERLLAAANNVGFILESLFKSTKVKYPELVGDIRGEGLLWGIDIVRNGVGPDPDLTKKLIFHLSTESRILVGVTGTQKSTILFTPPMCFTVDNAKRFCQALEDGLLALKSEFGDSIEPLADKMEGKSEANKRSFEDSSEESPSIQTKKLKPS